MVTCRWLLRLPYQCHRHKKREQRVSNIHHRTSVGGMETYEKHIYSDLLPLILEVVDVRPRHAFCRVRQYTCTTAPAFTTFQKHIYTSASGLRQVEAETDQPKSAFHFS